MLEQTCARKMTPPSARIQSKLTWQNHKETPLWPCPFPHQPQGTPILVKNQIWDTQNQRFPKFGYEKVTRRTTEAATQSLHKQHKASQCLPPLPNCFRNLHNLFQSESTGRFFDSEDFTLLLICSNHLGPIRCRYATLALSILFRPRLSSRLSTWYEFRIPESRIWASPHFGATGTLEEDATSLHFVTFGIQAQTGTPLT